MMQSILVIDEQEAMQEILSQTLSRLDFRVDGAVNGPEGIAKFDQDAFDLVTTDISISGIDGNGVVRHIRNSLRKTTPVIGISGTPWLFEEEIFDAVLTKPFSLAALRDTVQDLTATTAKLEAV